MADRKGYIAIAKFIGVPLTDADRKVLVFSSIEEGKTFINDECHNDPDYFFFWELADG